jgi:16S rRNA (guanine527-N7)-methyltransferase
MVPKDIFTAFLIKLFPSEYQYLIKKFELYYNWLVEENKKVNLISRKTKSNEIWIFHFLDSILPVQHFDFSNKKILDFGTGGGLPGIPISILFPDSEMFLLDSTKKKIGLIKNLTKILGITNCNFLDIRLENISPVYYSAFDIILCRSVRILPKYKKVLIKLLAKKGRIILFKSKRLDDIKMFEDFKIYDVSTGELGKRNIVEIMR